MKKRLMIKNEKEINDIKIELESQPDLKIIFDTILTYIDSNMLEEALVCVDDVLASPYLPIKILDFLTKLKKDLKNEINHIKYDNQINEMSKLQLWDKIYDKNSNHIDLTYFEIFINKYENEIDDVDLSLINTILTNKKINNIDKTNILLFCINSKLDSDLKIYNNELKKTYIVNPTKTDLLSQQNIIVKQLQDFYMKSPSYIPHAVNLLGLLTSYYLGSNIPYDNKLILSTIINVIGALFEKEEIVETELSSLLIEEISKLDK